MITRELLKKEIDKVDENYLDLIYKLVHVFETYSIEQKDDNVDLKSFKTLDSIYSFYDSLVFDRSDFKFNRDEANER